MPKITIHDSAKRPWGIETLVNVIDDDGKIFDFSLCNKSVTDKITLEQQALDMMNKQKQILADKTSPENDIDTLEEQKQTLISDIQDLQIQKDSLLTAVK